MISVDEAKNFIQQHVSFLPPIQIPLDESLGYALAEDVISDIDVPLYPQSFMDGYAFQYESLQNHSSLRIIGKVQAGSPSTLEVKKGEAVRIFTGAPVPQGADTVVMQEKATATDGFLTIEDQNLKKGDYVRTVGSEIRKGEVGLKAETLILPAGIGFLASIGKSHVSVISKPSVSIIITGDELQDVGKPIKYGQVYESNSHTVKAVLKQMGIKQVSLYKVHDSLEDLNCYLEEALHKSDMVLLTGGISVGEYDFVYQATKHCGVKKIFHKVRQKPGKPVFFGKKDNKVIFGLPGNPASVLTCFYHYVTLAMDCMSKTKTLLEVTTATLSNTYSKPKNTVHYLKGHFDGKNAHILEGQESYKLNSFAKSNCLIVIPEEKAEMKPGDSVQAVLIPTN